MEHIVEHMKAMADDPAVQEHPGVSNTLRSALELIAAKDERIRELEKDRERLEKTTWAASNFAEWVGENENSVNLTMMTRRWASDHRKAFSAIAAIPRPR